MRKAEAIYKFFAGYGMPAYEENSVPDGSDRPQYPYITYELRTADFGQYDTSVLFSIWDDSESIDRVLTKAEEIFADISGNKDSILGKRGKRLKCDGGYILVMPDEPNYEIKAEEEKRTVKRAMCSIKMRFYTNN